MTDIEIARNYKPKNLVKIAKKIKYKKKDLMFFGTNKCKVTIKKGKKQGKLILVTAINPTKFGIGKTTVSIGLADAFTMHKKRCCLALREPSLGPVFGTKGGATGGGYSQIVPMEDINLHFTGDFHSITSANNLLCSLVDNHIFQGNELNIDEKNIYVKRCLDLNERALRKVKIDAPYDREDNFTITAASEVMAIMCLATSIDDLKDKLGNIMVALNKDGDPVYAKDLGAENAMAILLKDALKPNLVQTLGGTPALVHMGPFANIAHGCNSVLATKLALSRADFVVTEAGFGADLGAQKFFDFKCKVAGLTPNAVVLVATIKALKLHGGVEEQNLDKENLEAIANGIENLKHHIQVIKNVYKLPLVVTLNKYSTDTAQEIELVKKLITDVKVVVNDVWSLGGAGAKELYEEVFKLVQEYNGGFSYSYQDDDSVENKIKAIVTKVYGGKNFSLSTLAAEKLRKIKKLKLEYLPIIMAKTQFSLSADKKLVNRPTDFEIKIDDMEIKTGAGFIVVRCGNMLLMPALGKNPAAIKMKIDNNGKIEGLF